jgi:hypothetical protein
MKNKIHTLSYFKKRLKDCGYVVWDIMNKYSIEDPRKWTIMLNPSVESLYITCVVNREELGSLPEFELNDGGLRFQKNLTVRTSSMEVIVNLLASKGINSDTSFYRKKE